MSTINDGGPAFPMQDPQAIHAWAQARIECMGLATTAERDAAYIQARTEAIGGLSIRDHFAGLAMQEVLSWEQMTSPSMVAKEAYDMADAMLKARATV